jgi:pimeloyl-ACP methyl ester carboxylesterase
VYTFVNDCESAHARSEGHVGRSGIPSNPETRPDRPGKQELRVDVAARLGLAGPLEIAATVHFPPPTTLRDPPLVIFALPGGGYSRGYYDMHFDGHTGYSEAQFHLERGCIFVGCDPIGVGQSTLPEPASITFELLAATFDAAAREIVARIEQGSLSAALPPLSGLRSVAIGQSMGGKICVLTQGRHRTFSGIGVLGASAIHTVLPQRTLADRESSLRGHLQQRGTDVSSTSVAESSRSIPDFLYPFHWEDEPPDIVAADMTGGYPLRRAPAPSFGSVTIPPCAVTMMSPGCIAEEAAAVEVPVLVGVGERDVCPTPLLEPQAYGRATDISVYIVPRMAHMHNFAPTRRLLWERIDAWAQRVVTTTGSRL